MKALSSAPNLRNFLLMFVVGLLIPLSIFGQELIVISEIVANNGGSFLDEDGIASDWIELYNSGGADVDIGGWHLTDDARDLTKWTFPATNFPPNSFMVVFASAKLQATPGLPMHTGFGLSASGGYLGLVHPDGVTIASEFAPAYPRQHSGFSYGLPQTLSIKTLISTNATLRYQIPENGSLARSWVQPSFIDDSWSKGTNGVGYELTVPGWSVHVYKANQTVDTLEKAETIIATPNLQVAVYAETAPTINYFNSGGLGHYGSDRLVPGFGSTDADDYVIEATGYVTIPSAGNWTFGVSSDDGFKLTVGAFTDICNCLRGPGDTLQTFNIPAPGDYPIRLVFFERGGGSEVEAFAVSGSAASWSAAFKLIGDTPNGGLAVKSRAISGATGGYAGFIRTDSQAAMLNKSSSAFLRIPFSVADTAALSGLTLSIRYDDGFVAYLNGFEVARRNAPVDPDWTSSATSVHAAAVPELVYLSDRIDLLRNGSNVLAIQGLNDATNGSDFLIQAELEDVKIAPLGGTYQFFNGNTPNAPNSLPPAGGFVNDIHFSATHGFYDAPISLSISCDTPDATIYYTTNGTVPTPINGILFASPLPISGTTTLRAVGYKAGQYPSAVATATYVFLQDIIRQPEKVAPGPAWPAPRGRGTGSQTYDFGMDQSIVNNPSVALTILSDLKSIRTFSVVMDLKDFSDPTTGFYSNPYGDTIAWERPCSLELLNPDGTPDFQINCGIRTRGGYSRSPDNPKHGLRFFFRSEYGQGSLKYPLLASQGGTDVFQKFDLRTFQNYSWSFDGDSRFTGLRDTFSRDTQLAMGQLATRGDYYHLYINGAYWGIYNIEERAEANFASSYLGGSSTNYDTVKVSPEDGYVIYATDGDLGAWTRLWMQATNGFSSNDNYFKVQGLNPDGVPNPAFENLLDVENMIDYMLVILYGGNLDAPISNFLGNTSPNNFFAVRDRTGAHGGFRFMAHDSEHTLLDGSANRIGPFPAGSPSGGGLYKSNPQYFWQQMWGTAEFKIKVADRAQKHFFNGGALVSSNALARLNVRSNMIFQAINAESARWGNANHSPAFTRTDWLSTMRFIYTSFVPTRGATVISQLKGKSLFPSVNAPGINQFGGRVPGGFNVVLSNPNTTGTIYYSLDDSDVRSIGGDVSPAATSYVPGASIPLFLQTRVRARILNGTTWSAQIDPVFFPEQDYSKLVISEIMYNPPALGSLTSDNLEFLEFKNTSTSALDLSGAYFTSGIKFTFPPKTRIEPGQFFVIAHDSASFRAKYPGIIPQGQYAGKLSNKGDTLRLVDALGGPIISFTYGNSGQWPLTTDGHGFSLVPRSGALDWNEPLSWRASTVAGGSPGGEDPEPSNIGVVINEILANSVPPQTDFVELLNPTGTPVDISYWTLTDDPNAQLKYRIPPGTVLAPSEFRVFTEADFNRAPGSPGNFALSSAGDEIYLLAADASGALTGYSHGFKFSGTPDGVSIGRLLTSVGAERFELQIAQSPEIQNSGPVVGPIIIHKIMYHPLDFLGANNKSDEFIELRNISESPVTLADAGIPANGWHLRGTASFDFPSGITLAPSGTVILTSIDPADTIALAAFRAKYSTPATVPAIGPYLGALGNEIGSIELLRPGTSVGGVIPYIRVDRIDYEGFAPWAGAANGGGAALQRVASSAYGNDPTNWVATRDLVVWSPPTNIFVRPSSNFTFSVLATAGAPLSYRWRLNDTDLINDSHFSGVATSNLLVLNSQASIAGDYSVVISDGFRSTTSGPAALRLLINPVISQSPSNQTVVQGDSLILTVQVGNAATLPLTYEWQKQGVSFQTNISVANFDAITLPNVQSNINVRVTVKNSSIPSGVTSANATITVLADSDRDHIPDAWETLHGLDPTNPGDALIDSDGDGSSNVNEFRAGTDPQDSLSVLRCFARIESNGELVLQIPALINRTYTVQVKASLDSESWSTLTNISAPLSNQIVEIREPVASANLTRFFRLVTPAVQ